MLFLFYSTFVVLTRSVLFCVAQHFVLLMFWALWIMSHVTEQEVPYLRGVITVKSGSHILQPLSGKTRALDPVFFKSLSATSATFKFTASPLPSPRAVRHLAWFVCINILSGASFHSAVLFTIHCPLKCKGTIIPVAGRGCESRLSLGGSRAPVFVLPLQQCRLAEIGRRCHRQAHAFFFWEESCGEWH